MPTLGYTSGEINQLLAQIEDQDLQPKLTGTAGQVVGFNADGAATAVPGWSNPNLLDNWYFADPINQRGETEMVLSANRYHLDRWKGNRVNLALTNEGLSFAWTEGLDNGFILQPIEIERVAGNNVTLSAVIDGELHAYTYEIPQTETTLISPVTNDIRVDLEWKPSNGVAQMTIRNYSHTAKVIKAAKLELGTQQTLAHQDADGSWVLNDPPPNKALELVRCQRYYMRGSTQPRIGHKLTDQGVIVEIPSAFRANPTTIPIAEGAAQIYTLRGWLPLTYQYLNRPAALTSLYYKLNDSTVTLEDGKSYMVRNTPALSADL